MRAVTDGLMAAFERIGRGAFVVSGHRFEVAGADVRNLKGVPVGDRITLYNVIAELPGATDEFVLVTAHLDSTAKTSYDGQYDPRYHDAPGMDDDGSGTAAVLLIAEVMRNIFAGRRPRCRPSLRSLQCRGARTDWERTLRAMPGEQGCEDRGRVSVGHGRLQPRGPQCVRGTCGTSVTSAPADPEVEEKST